MRSKNILSIAAFVIAFSLSTVLASFFITKTYPTTFEVVSYSSHSNCSKSRHNLNQSLTAREITEFIRQDKANGRERDRKIFGVGIDFRPAFDSSNYDSYVEAVEEYVDDSSNLDASEFPREFQKKWADHIKTWHDYSDFLNEMKDSSNRKNFEIEELLAIDNQQSAEINRTWDEVLQVGSNYGADVY